MITLTALLKLIRTSDALTITTICDKLVHRSDRADFELGKGSLWVSERVSWRRELVLALGYGSSYVWRAEQAVEETKSSEWILTSADQRRDLHLQKAMIAEIVQEYLYMLSEGGHDVEWVVKDGGEWGRVFDVKFKSEQK